MYRDQQGHITFMERETRGKQCIGGRKEQILSTNNRKNGNNNKFSVMHNSYTYKYPVILICTAANEWRIEQIHNDSEYIIPTRLNFDICYVWMRILCGASPRAIYQLSRRRKRHLFCSRWLPFLHQCHSYIKYAIYREQIRRIWSCVRCAYAACLLKWTYQFVFENNWICFRVKFIVRFPFFLH